MARNDDFGGWFKANRARFKGWGEAYKAFNEETGNGHFNEGGERVRYRAPAVRARPITLRYAGGVPEPGSQAEAEAVEKYRAEHGLNFAEAQRRYRAETFPHGVEAATRRAVLAGIDEAREADGDDAIFPGSPGEAKAIAAYLRSLGLPARRYAEAAKIFRRHFAIFSEGGEEKLNGAEKIDYEKFRHMMDLYLRSKKG